MAYNNKIISIKSYRGKSIIHYILGKQKAIIIK